MDVRILRPAIAVLAAVAIGSLTAGLAVVSPAGADSPFSASVSNAATFAGSGALALTHNYPSGTCTSVPGAPITATNTSSIGCPGRLYPAGTANQSSTAAITNNGNLPSGAILAQRNVLSCGTVRLANAVLASDPMLPRYSTTLNGTSGSAGTAPANPHPLAGGGSITFNGTTDYASDVTAVSSPILSLLSGVGMGIWFKTTSSAGGGLFSFDSSPVVPAAATGNNYLALYLTPAGRLGFVGNVGANIGTSAASYNDGSWHYAMVSITTVLGLFGIQLSTVSLYVDGATSPVAAALGLTLTGLSTGYWHVGWSQAAGYFAGSQASFTVLATAPASGAGFYAAGSQSGYDSVALAAAATLEWRFDDSGISTFAGSYPVIGSVQPCSMVTASWDGAPPVPLATLAGASMAVTAPGAGLTVPSTLTLGRAGGYVGAVASYLPGLQLYAPISYTVSAGVSMQWTTQFRWDGAGSSFPA